MKSLKSFFLIVNYQTFLVTAISLISTALCHYYEITADFSLSLVGVAIVFPIVFSINSAYKRREDALASFADLKAHGLAIFFASRNWSQEDTSSITKNIKIILVELLKGIRTFFLSTPDNKIEHEHRMYDIFTNLSNEVQRLRDYLPAGEISRLNQFVSKMMISFDKMKVIYNYRTPVTLRAYSKVFIYTFPIIYAPYFATFQSKSEYAFFLGYVMPVLYSFILVSLDNIQDHLEDPYDQIGEDDIIIDVEDYDELLIESPKDLELTK